MAELEQTVARLTGRRRGSAVPLGYSFDDLARADREVGELLRAATDTIRCMSRAQHVPEAGRGGAGDHHGGGTGIPAARCVLLHKALLDAARDR
jgi:hypothetical protein